MPNDKPFHKMRLSSASFLGGESTLKNKKILAQLFVIICLSVCIVVLAALAIKSRVLEQAAGWIGGSRFLPASAVAEPCMFGKEGFCYNIPKNADASGEVRPLQSTWPGAKQICRFYGENLATFDADYSAEAKNQTKGSLWDLLLFELTNHRQKQVEQWQSASDTKDGGSGAAWTKFRFPACVWIRKAKNREEEKNNRKFYRWNGKSAEFGDAATEDGSRRLRRRRCDALMFDDEEKRKVEIRSEGTSAHFDAEATTVTTAATTTTTTSAGRHARGMRARVAREARVEVEAAQVEGRSSEGIYGAARRRRRKKDRYRDFKDEGEEREEEEEEEEEESQEEEEGKSKVVARRGKRAVWKRNCNHRCFFVCVRTA